MEEILHGIDSYTGPSFSLRNRARRVVWNSACFCLFRYTPRVFHRWRCALLRLFGAKIGSHCRVYPGTRIWAPWHLVMDDYACLANDVTCYSMAKIHISERAIVSQGTHLCCGTHNYSDPLFQLYAEPIVIGRNAWVCAESFIAPGVTVGEGAVVGARSVVTRDIPAWMVCAGNPCRPLKKREFK
ncbi:MAG: putative colanic acid biosynthesis acetyltransferase [Candidatus Margulisiibacteriota bacterium]|nr:MAG: acetyltransferase [Candidatus Margulisbacteria bacterium GWD2_39_127]OGI01845.1 MAG: acetyltransferase [Candidatus Margulisbacteria bacterium GWF2_38_17]OGI10167.1 MAG: acetyltransferase [Candidatus Margulisbacteria bacterium GWE2_39_32]PZM79496.1 MAG: putative colanic acid biosynthesis acetyltransferase [Candidatus Margulisiibacteriota bacterium]HAR63833.1 putative colanic acid biosynthesis acetyltransferase [Candidatus Margulisiibacteriota bacterium]